MQVSFCLKLLKLTFKSTCKVKVWCLGLLLIMTLLFQQVSAQTLTIIEGEAPEYAGLNLVFRALVNPVSMEKVDLLTIRVDEEGHFKDSVEISAVTNVSVDLGKFRGNIYMEPGLHYQIILPPHQPRSDAERFNPYFVPEDVVIGIVNDESQKLNSNIIHFDAHLDELYNAEAVQIFSRGDKAKVKAIIHELDSLYPATKDSYFDQYKKYAYGEVKSLAYKRQKRTLIKEVFDADTVDLNMPSFKVAFNVIFKSFFSSYLSSKAGKDLKDAFVKVASFDSLSMVIAKDDLFYNKEFAELVLLKSLYDAFYSGRYNQLQIINLFKQAETLACNSKIKELAVQLHHKVNWLRAGSDAPGFTLYRLDGKERSLDSYEGKFVYLNFMHTENHACRQDLQLLNVISKRMKRDVTLVTIILDEDPTDAKKIVKENKYRWDFLHYGRQPSIALDYGIRALPVYYVIDPEGRLRLTPAPAPGESFGPIFMEAVRQYNHEKLRKEQPKEKSIYDF